MTPSIRVARSDLGLHRVAVVFPGAKRYPLAEDVEVVPLSVLDGSWDPFEPDNTPEHVG
jgi:hypothetical protein